MTLIPVPIPHDCTDGFYGAFWRRPDAYLDPTVRAGTSVFASCLPTRSAPASRRSEPTWTTASWHRRHADLLDLGELDLGYYVVVAEVGA